MMIKAAKQTREEKLERGRQYRRQYRLEHREELREKSRQKYLDSRPSPVAALAGYRRLAYETLLGGFQELAEEVQRGCQDEAGVDELIDWMLDTEWVQWFTQADPAHLRTVIDRILDGWVPPTCYRHHINRRAMRLTPSECRPHPLGKKAMWRE